MNLGFPIASGAQQDVNWEGRFTIAKQVKRSFQEMWAANFLLMIHRELFEELEKILCCYEVHN
jgi:hypothetical protein